uniref:Centrosomal protein 57 n=1 Tax=Hippocampus comes TaxID=109280 RepID=A0A3Q2YR90_HIPCM
MLTYVGRIDICSHSSSPLPCLGAAILSALRHLQEKIRRLELANKGGHRRHVMVILTQASFYCCAALVSQLAAAESRCLNLERQLDQMRKMLHNAQGEKKNLLKQQVRNSNSDSQYGPKTHYRTRIMMSFQVKIHELELKLQEEEHQRKLVQDKANQVPPGKGILRGLFNMSSNMLNCRGFHQFSHWEPHYRLNLSDVPFVAGKVATSPSDHSVRANVQSVLSLLKRHQPQLCNSRVLASDKNAVCPGGTNRRHSDAASGSASSTSGELAELLQALQEELRVMSLEQDQLMRELDRSVSLQERRQLEREQETLLLKMERKGEQISKLYKHKIQVDTQTHTY